MNKKNNDDKEFGHVLSELGTIYYTQGFGEFLDKAKEINIKDALDVLLSCHASSLNVLLDETTLTTEDKQEVLELALNNLCEHARKIAQYKSNEWDE